MKIVIINSNLTGRVTHLKLKADSFDDERILKMVLDGLAEGSLFELTKDGEPRGSFTFNGFEEKRDRAA